MPSEETLAAISQLGIAFAAFVTIFFAFSRGLGEFSVAQKLRIRTILFVCFWVMFAGLLPLVLDDAVSPDHVMTISSSVALAAFMLLGTDSFRYVKSMSSAQRRSVRDANFYISWVLAMLIMTCLALVIADIGSGMYLLAATGGLALCTSNFITFAFERLFRDGPEE